MGVCCLLMVSQHEIFKWIGVEILLRTCSLVILGLRSRHVEAMLQSFDSYGDGQDGLITQPPIQFILSCRS